MEGDRSLMVGDVPPVGKADALVRLAKVWQAQDRPSAAIQCYDNALKEHSGFREAFVGVTNLLLEQGDWAAVEERCNRWLQDFPEHATHSHSDAVHNLRIQAQCALGGIELAYERHGLRKLTSREPSSAGGPIALLVERNERQRLPYLLEHHRALGVTEFLVVDNNSDDGSAEYLLTQADVVLWQTDQSYRLANCGASWWDLILRRFVRDRWVLIVDADELFIYPDVESVPLPVFCDKLDSAGATAYRALLVDMYSEGRLADAHYEAGQPFLETCPYFDRTAASVRLPFDGPARNMTNYWGGMRSRVFGGPDGGYLLNKTPLFRYQHGEVLHSGQHWLERPTEEIANGRGGLLHFKYFSSFARFVAVEAERGELPNEGQVQKHYLERLQTDPDITLFDPLHSARFRHSNDLVDLGIMGRLDQPPTQICSPEEIPQVSRRSRPADAPALSVVVIATQAASEVTPAVARLIDSVATDDAELIVLLPRHLTAELERFAEPWVDDPQVSVQACERSLGAIEMLTLALESGTGTWVNVRMSSDDADLSGVAQLLQEAESSNLGFVFCPEKKVSDVDLLISPGSFVIRRDVVSEIGGFWPRAGWAAPWEFIQRAAAHGTILTSPTDAALFPACEPNLQQGSGVEVGNAALAIHVVGERLQNGQQHVAEWEAALVDLARRHIDDAVESGGYAAAVSVVAEVLRANVSDSQKIRIAEILTRTIPW